MSDIRVRFAPSPTGYLHIGGARTCLFNWLYARHNGGKLILRIEDTDLERLKENSIEQILRSLKWLGLNWDEGPDAGGLSGPYHQSKRLELYKKEAERLIKEGKAYYCYCTPEELELQRQEAMKEKKDLRYNSRCRSLLKEDEQKFIAEGRKPVVRLKVPYEGVTVVEDLVRGRVTFENALLDDFIIVKSNGIAAYNFACAVDDHSMGITQVIRAEEHLSNTPKQVLAYTALGYGLPEFAHVPMILAPDRSKLSKRHGATSVEEFRDQGFLPEAIVNYLCLLGWSTQNQEDIISLDEAAKQFSLERVSKNASVYDTKKLAWINGHYLKTGDLDRIVGLAIPFLRQQRLVGDDIGSGLLEKIKSMVVLLRERVLTLVELANASDYFFNDLFDYDEKGLEKYFKKEGCIGLLEGTLEKIATVEPFDAATIEAVYRSHAEEKGLKAGDVIHPTRLALTGRTATPGLFEIMVILGREECIKRIKRAMERIKNMI